MATGLIQSNMGRPDAEGDQLSPEVIKQNMKIPPELQNAYDRVVLAGMKLMFSKESNNFVMKQVQSEGPIGPKLGESIAGLMLMMFMESNKTMPPQVIIPAGLELLAQAADFLRKSKLAQVSNKDFGDATEIMMTIIMQKFGVTPEKMQQLFAQFNNQKANAAAGQMQAPAQGQQPPMGA